MNFCALLCRHLLWPIRKLDIRSGLRFADNLDQMGGKDLYSGAVLRIVGLERSLQIGVR